MFSAAAATTRLATRKGTSSLLATSLKSNTAPTSKLAALARSSKVQSRNFLSRPDPELIRSAIEPLKNHWKTIVAGLAVGTGLVHTVYGNEDNFYDKRFILECDPDDLADFYGSENFMVGAELFCRSIDRSIIGVSWPGSDSIHTNLEEDSILF